MKKYYAVLMQFTTNGESVSKYHLLNIGSVTGNTITEEELRVLEELGYIKNVGLNAYGEPLYKITDAGRQYRDN